MPDVGGLIFGADQPSVTDGADSTVYCMGTTFRSDIAGSIPKVYWRVPNALPGAFNALVLPIQAQLWKVSTASIVATTQFDTLTTGVWNEFSVTGWDIDADTDYIFSVVTDRYTATSHYFDTAKVNGHITAPIEAGKFYDIGTSGSVTPSMPNSQFNAGGYFMDVDFATASAGLTASVWTGSVELPVTSVAVWNGTSEVPATFDSVVA